MKKKYRLLKNQDFKEVLDNHRCVSRENLKIFYKSNQLEHCRVGVSVSSKIGNAVVRHKIKRQVTSMLDKCLNISESIDIVVIVKNRYLDFTYNQNYEIVEKNVNEILKRSKINEK